MNDAMRSYCRVPGLRFAHTTVRYDGVGRSGGDEQTDGQEISFWWASSHRRFSTEESAITGARRPAARGAPSCLKMGTSESRAAGSEAVDAIAVEVHTAAESNEPSLDEEVEPQKSLLELPPELFCSICSLLDLVALSALSSVCLEAHTSVPDELWKIHLCRLQRAGIHEAIVDPRTRSNLTTVQREAIIRRRIEADDAATFVERAAALASGASSLRVQVGGLRELVCAVCEAAPATSMWFATTKRGVCRECVRTKPSEADEWRYYQSGREKAAVAARDAKTGALLHEALESHLPYALRDTLPRLTFSSEENGGSLASLLRSAEHVSSSLLLVVSEGGEEACSCTFGAFCPVPWPRFPNERPTSYFGDGNSFLYAMSPKLRVYPATGRDEHYFRCDGTRGTFIRPHK